MKIDFSDIYDIGTCFAREARLLHNAILESNDKEELLLAMNKIEIASLERQDVILSEMLENVEMKLEDFDVNKEFKETD